MTMRRLPEGCNFNFFTRSKAGGHRNGPDAAVFAASEANLRMSMQMETSWLE
jgi:hypothetical protein